MTLHADQNTGQHRRKNAHGKFKFRMSHILNTSVIPYGIITLSYSFEPLIVICAALQDEQDSSKPLMILSSWNCTNVQVCSSFSAFFACRDVD